MVRLILTVILIASATGLWGQVSSNQIGREISITPIVFGIHRTGAGTWHPDKKPVSFAGWGLKGAAAQGQWQIKAELVLMRFFGLQKIPNRFSPEQGFDWKQHATGSLEEFDTDYSNFELSYQNKGLTAFLGKFSPTWGPALHSIVISQKAPTYPQFGFEWQLSDRLRFSYMHADLFSGIVDASQTQTSGLIGERVVHLKRYLAAHRLELELLPQLILGLSELVVYGGRGMETMYLMPFVSYFSVEHYLGDRDNVLMSVDLALYPRPNLKLYGEFLVDEWRPQDTFKETNRNWFAWQGGIDWQSILTAEDRFNVEATWTDHRVYRHRYSANEFYSHHYPIGHWIGPHAQSLMATYALPLWDTWFQVAYLYAKRGQITLQMIRDQYLSIPYNRFEGTTETIQTVDLSVAREILPALLPGLWLEGAISYIIWNNAGFDPFDPEGSTLADVDKTSINVGFYYNFSIPGYAITALRSR